MEKIIMSKKNIVMGIAGVLGLGAAVAGTIYVVNELNKKDKEVSSNEEVNEDVEETSDEEVEADVEVKDEETVDDNVLTDEEVEEKSSVEEVNENTVPNEETEEVSSDEDVKESIKVYLNGMIDQLTDSAEDLTKGLMNKLDTLEDAINTEEEYIDNGEYDLKYNRAGFFVDSYNHLIKNGSVVINPEYPSVKGYVTIDYTTNETTAKAYIHWFDMDEVDFCAPLRDFAKFVITDGDMEILDPEIKDTLLNINA